MGENVTWRISERDKDNCRHVDSRWIFSLNLKNDDDDDVPEPKASLAKNCQQNYNNQSKNINFLFFMIIILLLGWSGTCNAAEVTDLSRLRRDLLNSYDKQARPIQNHENTTIVRFNVYLKGFDFDEQRSVFTLYAWSVLSWRDEHIKWEPKLYGNISRIHFAAHELWLPDLSVFNNLDKSEIDHFGNTRILAYSNSLVVWVPPTKFQVGCSSNLRNWPVDNQICQIVVGSWAHDGSMLNIRLPVNQTTMDTTEFLKNREWKLIGTGMEKREHVFGGVPYPDVLMTFHIEREGSTHKAAVVVPGLAIAMGVLIAFWIQPGVTERIVLLLACIINNTMYLSYIYRSIPNNGDSVPLILLFYRDSLMMISIALIWTICLRYLAASKRTSPVPLPGFVQSFLASIPAKILCLDPRPTTSSMNNSDGLRGGGGESGDGGVDTGKLVGSGNPYQQDWAWLAHLLDRVAFLLYLIIYLIFYIALL